ncbi:MAG: MgtC/SapB family protein [Planctomycetes bacterium]|nr:MgtC/SapB family protein [Planctomycetota bacterium]
MTHSTLVDLAVALGIGLLVGIERERRKGDGPHRRPAGVRTFAVGSLVGAVSWIMGGAPVLAAAVLGVALLVAVAYWRRREDDPGLTTEVALLLTVLLGALAMSDSLLAAGLGAALAGLLFARDRIHHFARTLLTERELVDALVLAAAALIVLPLIPDRYVGPFEAVNPRTLWLIVVLVMSMGAVGHVARRLLGPRFGLPVTGLAGGFVSSVATIVSMGQVAKQDEHLLAPAAAGAVLSTVVTAGLMAALLAVTSPPALAALALPLILFGAVATAYSIVLTLRGLRAQPPAASAPGRAFSLVTALVLTATISVMLLGAAAVEAWLGQTGLIVAAALGGFSDAHAAGVSVASLVDAGKLEAHAAVVPILAVMSANTITKIVVAFGAGVRFGRLVVPALVLMLAAAWLGAWLERAT